jgi:hypothetical protein
MYFSDNYLCLSSGKTKNIMSIPGPDLALNIKILNIRSFERVSILNNQIDHARAGLLILSNSLLGFTLCAICRDVALALAAGL